MSYHPKAVRDHWNLIAAMSCMACNRYGVQIAHCHGPSLRERDPRFLKAKGKKMPYGDWLVIPLCVACHMWMDNDPAKFAALYGTPASLLDRLCESLGYDLWARAAACLKPRMAA